MRRPTSSKLRARRSVMVTSITMATTLAAIAGTPSVEEMLELPIEELLDIKITTASKLSESADVAPATVYVVTAEQIERLGLRDLKDVLAIVPGVDTIHPHFFLLGGQRGYMGTFAQSLLLINGREVNNLIAGETFIANQFRAHNIKQVEIIAGPGSALYGANAVAGVINIITKDVEGVQVSLGGGSWNTKEVGATFGQTRGEFKIQGAVSIYRSDGPDFSGFLSDPARAAPQAENNAYRHLPRDYGYASDEDALAYQLEIANKGWYAGMNYYRNIMGRGTSGIQWDYTNGEDYRELWLLYTGYRREKMLDGRLDARMEYRYYWEQFWGNHTENDGPLVNPRTGVTNTVDATIEDVEDFRGFYSNKNRPGSRKHVALVESTWRTSDRNTLIGGVQYEYADIVGAAWSRTNGVHPPIGEDQQWPEFSNGKIAVYGQDQLKFPAQDLTLTLGARYEDHQEYGGTFIPRGGLVWQPVKTSIFKLLYGRSFREPTVFELRNGPGIKPMEMETYEVGWHQYLGSYFKNEAVVFVNRATDMIVSDSTEVGGIANKGELDAEGFEDVLSFNFGPFKGFLNYTYTTSELDEPEKGRYDVYDLPEHKANLAGWYEFLGRYALGAVLRYRGEVDTEYYGETITLDDFVTLDLNFSVLKLDWFAVPGRLDLTVKNVLDEDYYDPEPRAPSVVKHPQAERAAFAQLVLNF